MPNQPMTPEGLRKDIWTLVDNEVQLHEQADDLTAELLQLFAAFGQEICSNLEQSVKQHTVPEGFDLVTRSYVINSIAFERARLTALTGKENV